MEGRREMKVLNLWPFALKLLPGRRKATVDQLTFTALGAAALLLPFFLRPAADLVGTHTQLFLPPCFFLRVTGIPCPTCGMTTSFAFLAHGRILDSLAAHPLGTLTYLYIAVLTMCAAGATAARRAVEIIMRAKWTEVLMALGAAWVCKLAVWLIVR